MRLIVGLPWWARYGAALLSVAAVTVAIAALGRFHLANASATAGRRSAAGRSW